MKGDLQSGIVEKALKYFPDDLNKIPLFTDLRNSEYNVVLENVRLNKIPLYGEEKYGTSELEKLLESVRPNMEIYGIDNGGDLRVVTPQLTFSFNGRKDAMTKNLELFAYFAVTDNYDGTVSVGLVEDPDDDYMLDYDSVGDSLELDDVFYEGQEISILELLRSLFRRKKDQPVIQPLFKT